MGSELGTLSDQEKIRSPIKLCATQEEGGPSDKIKRGKISAGEDRCRKS